MHPHSYDTSSRLMCLIRETLSNTSDVLSRSIATRLRLKMGWCVLFKKNIFERFFQMFNLNICRTDLRPICRDGRTMVVDVRSEEVFQSLEGSCHSNQFFGPSRPPFRTFDSSSRFVHEILAYGKKCNNRAINRSVLLICLCKQVTWFGCCTWTS